MKPLLSALLLAVSLTGCLSVHVCDVGESMVSIENSGWYLFSCLPIISGDPRYLGGMHFRFFSDTVTLENNSKILDRVAEREHAKAVQDVVSYTTDEHALVFLAKRRVLHTSARLVK